MRFWAYLGTITISLLAAYCAGTSGNPPSPHETCAVTCGVGSACGAGQVCRDGCCVEGCDTNADCPSSEMCISNRCVLKPAASDAGTRPDAGTPYDAGTTTDGGALANDVGQPCTSNSQCAYGSCLNLPNGYCTKPNCSSSSPCPDGSRCFSLPGSSPATACFKNCTSPSDCRVSEGYTCDSDNTCYRARTDGGTTADAGTPPADAGPPANDIGQACQGNSDCAYGSCLNLPNGYCTMPNCSSTSNPCPEGSRCFSLPGSTPPTACFKECTSTTDCRADEGYACDSDNTCYRAPPDGGTTDGGGASADGG